MLARLLEWRHALARARPRPDRPLAGVRVLDLSRILAGPFSTQVMADLGADVIKVERPGTGDETRRWGPPYAPSGDAAYFSVCNRGRRSLTLDLSDTADRELALTLVQEPTCSWRTQVPCASSASSSRSSPGWSVWR